MRKHWNGKLGNFISPKKRDPGVVMELNLCTIYTNLYLHNSVTVGCNWIDITGCFTACFAVSTVLQTIVMSDCVIRGDLANVRVGRHCVISRRAVIRPPFKKFSKG